MKKFIELILLGVSMSVGTANALPIFSHTTDGAGLFTISVDATNEPTALAGLNVDSIIGTVIGSDGGINFPDYFSIADLNSDGLLQFTFDNTDNLTELTGSAFYADESTESYTYSLGGAVVNPPVPDPTTPPSAGVPEPSAFLLLGAGLIGIGVTRRYSRNQQ